MSLDLSGRDDAIVCQPIKIDIPKEHPLIKLANMLHWSALFEIVIPDLKKTTAKGFWWLGRKLIIRIHLGAYILQRLYNLTDRQTEYGIKDNAAYQLFCGKGVVDTFNPPDHTKIEEFRNRLSAETQRKLANETAKIAVELGFGDPRDVDFDSTVQQANIAYPSDADLMTKLAGMGKKILDYLREKGDRFIPEDIEIDMKLIKSKAREYFFLAKNTGLEKRREVFASLHKLIKRQMRPVVDICQSLHIKSIEELPWNIHHTVNQIREDAWRYLLDVAHFIRTQSLKSGKILSFHSRAVTCIKKGKLGKEKEFGRVFQLGRIKGNFLYVLASTSLRMEDKHCLVPLIEEHVKIFGKYPTNSLGADKGYWSAKNLKAVKKTKTQLVGLQCPKNIKDTSWQPEEEIHQRLINRRAGIEPLIGHVKGGGQLGKSRMKSDTATLAAGYSSILGFNLRQLMKKQSNKMRKVA